MSPASLTSLDVEVGRGKVNDAHESVKGIRLPGWIGSRWLVWGLDDIRGHRDEPVGVPVLGCGSGFLGIVR